MDARNGNEPARERTTLERRSNRELVITRTFDAPPRFVFDAWTRPELLERWWAPRLLGVTLFECEADVRPGGSYRYVFGRGPSQSMAFSGVYREVTPHARLVYTQIFEPARDAGAAIVTATFEPHDDKTRFVQHGVYPSKEVVDATVASGMERGMRDTMEQLAQLLASQR